MIKWLLDFSIAMNSENTRISSIWTITFFFPTQIFTLNFSVSFITKKVDYTSFQNLNTSLRDNIISLYV